MKPLIAAFFLVPTLVHADPAIIKDVVASHHGDRLWTFHVTIRHNDAGWEDYADGWRVEHSDGKILGERVLYHPHVDEQPFTRSLSNVEIPQDVTTIKIRARTLIEGWGDTTLSVHLIE